jgi:benzoylformate decarboxylase
MRAVDVLFDILRSEGVAKIFGNPGSTELPLMDALVGQKDFQYVLGLQEATVVGMADGYAQATNRASFVNLHTVGGLGHALGTIAGSKLTRTPMVITAGNQDTKHLAQEPWLSGDLVSMARPCVKWATQVERAEDVGVIMRRAFAIANASPRGPVFVALPMDLMLQEVKAPAPAKSAPIEPASANISALMNSISATTPEDICLLLSDSVLHEDGGEAAIAAADALGCRVYGTPLLGRNVFPLSHKAWRGVLPPDFAAIRKILTPFKLAIMIGDHEMLAYPARDVGPFPETLKLAQISSNPSAIGFDGATTHSLVGHIGETLKAIAQASPKRATRADYAKEHQGIADTLHAALNAKESQTPLYPPVAVRAVLSELPKGAQVVNESSGTYDTMREQWTAAAPGDYYFVRSGNLGWGMPAAVGVALAKPQSRVVSFVGDGASMYSPQAIWSSVRYSTNVVFIIFNNRKYDILMRVAKSLGFPKANANEFVEMDFSATAVNFAGLAQTFNVPYALAKTEAEIASHIKALLAKNQTAILEIETTGL